MGWYVGLDLGKSNDYTALSVVQTVWERDQENGKPEKVLHLRYLERYPLGTPYTSIADSVRELLVSPQFHQDEYDPTRHRVAKPPLELLIDRTGVGEGVVDIFKERRIRPTEITITGMSERAHRTGTRRWSVPKADLVAALLIPFEKGSLKIAEGLTLWPTLREELLDFRRKQNARTGHTSYEHWRETAHDNMVLATAMACWGPQKPKTGTTWTRVMDVHGRWHTL